MFLRAYLPKFLTAFIGGIFLATGIFSFGNAMIFERLYFGVLIFTGIICRKNINIMTIIAILFLQLFLDKLAWQLLKDEFSVKIVLYLIIVVMLYRLRFDWITKVIFITFLLVILTEIYWFISNYPAPQVFWHVWIMCSALLTRYLIFSRVSIIAHYLQLEGKSINLDWVIYNLTAFTIILQVATILEYLCRHLIGMSQLTIVYNIYPYLIHLIAILYIWSTFNESYKYILPRFFKA